jgi:hypothetical protein
LAVREDDAEPEPLEDESKMLEDGDVVAMAVKVGIIAQQLLMQCTHTIIGCVSDSLLLSLFFNQQEPPLLWRIFPADRVTLSKGGAVATQTVEGRSLTTTGTEMTEGKHFWEVERLSRSAPILLIGISRPNLDATGCYVERDCTDGWFIHADQGSLYGNGKEGDDVAGDYKQGDRVGMLLDLDNGSLRFFKNGVEHGPGYPAGSVTGPVVAAVQMYNEDESVRLLPNAEAPAGV